MDVAALLKRIEVLEDKVMQPGGGGSTEDEPAPESPYSFVVSVALDPDSSVMARVVAAALITSLTIVQLLLVFAFSDSSTLMTAQGSMPLYKTPIPMGNFYEARIEDTPTITVITAVLALFLLAFSMKEALSNGSLLAASPSEYLLYLAEFRAWDTLPEIIYNITALAFLETMFLVRLTVLPCLVMWGSVALWNAEGTATDIVKDSVVITYVIELDTMFYKLAASTLKARYETKTRYGSRSRAKECAGTPGWQVADVCGGRVLWARILWDTSRDRQD